MLFGPSVTIHSRKQVRAEGDTETWAGYVEAVPDNPSAALTDATLLLSLNQLPESWWARVTSDGRDIRPANAAGDFLPFDLIRFNRAARTGLVAFKITKATTNQTIRVYAGNVFATAPAADDAIGRHNAYASSVKAFYPDGGGNDRTSNANNLTMTGSPTVGGAAGPISGSAATDYSGTQYGLATASVPTADPMTLELWGSSDSDSAAQVPMSVNDNTDSGQSSLLFRGNSGGDPVAVNRNNVAVQNGGGYTAGAYAHVAGVFSGATSRLIYVNGSASSTNTTNSAAPTATQILVGGFRPGSIIGFDGKISLAMLHTVAISAAHAAYSHAMGNQTTFWNGWSEFRDSQISLLTDLVSYWAMDEASGNALDAHGENDLTETSGTIDSAAGKIGNARDFEAGDTEYFERASNASLATGDIDFTVAFWVNAETLASFPAIMHKGWQTAGSVNREWITYVNTSSSRLYFEVVQGSSGTPAAAIANNHGNVSTGVWLFVVVWHDSVNNQIGISVNNGTPNLVSHSAGVNAGTGVFQIGASSSQNLWWDGLIDGVGFWKRVLSASERELLFNGGSGLAYPFE